MKRSSKQTEDAQKYQTYQPQKSEQAWESVGAVAVMDAQSQERTTALREFYEVGDVFVRLDCLSPQQLEDLAHMYRCVGLTALAHSQLLLKYSKNGDGAESR